MTADRTAAACERLFALMDNEPQSYWRPAPKRPESPVYWPMHDAWIAQFPHHVEEAS